MAEGALSGIENRGRRLIEEDRERRAKEKHAIGIEDYEYERDTRPSPDEARSERQTKAEREAGRYRMDEETHGLEMVEAEDKRKARRINARLKELELEAAERKERIAKTLSSVTSEGEKAAAINAVNEEVQEHLAKVYELYLLSPDAAARAYGNFIGNDKAHTVVEKKVGSKMKLAVVDKNGKVIEHPKLGKAIFDKEGAEQLYRQRTKSGKADKPLVQIHDPDSPTGSKYVRREDAIGQPGKASRPPATLAPVAPTKGDFENLEALMSRHPEFAGMRGEDEFKFAVAARARELMKSERLDQYSAMRKALEEYKGQVDPGEKRELFGMDWWRRDKPARFNPIRKYNPATGRIE
jgi:hypothetical protein